LEISALDHCLIVQLLLTDASSLMEKTCSIIQKWEYHSPQIVTFICSDLYYFISEFIEQLTFWKVWMRSNKEATNRAFKYTLPNIEDE
jgi:hypothetical protein